MSDLPHFVARPEEGYMNTLREWIIPHIAPRDHGLITISAPVMPSYEPEVELPQLYQAGSFARLLEELYRHHRARLFVVPWTWLAQAQLPERAATILTIAEVCPTIVL